MKKVLFAIALFSISVSSFAQSFGIKAGINLANVSGDLGDNLLVGFNVGPTVDFKVSDGFGFQTGLILNSKGFKGTISENGIYAGAEISMLALDIPLLAKANYLVSDNIKLYGTFGPYIGYALSGKMKLSVMGNDLSEDLTFNDEDGMKRFDFGLSVGAGIELKSISIGASYGLGLAKISEGDDAPKNRIISFSIGYKF